MDVVVAIVVVTIVVDVDVLGVYCVCAVDVGECDVMFSLPPTSSSHPLLVLLVMGWLMSLLFVLVLV